MKLTSHLKQKTFGQEREGSNLPTTKEEDYGRAVGKKGSRKKMLLVIRPIGFSGPNGFL